MTVLLKEKPGRPDESVPAECGSCGAEGFLIDPPAPTPVNPIQVLCGPCSTGQETVKVTLTEEEAMMLADVMALAFNGDEDETISKVLDSNWHLLEDLHDRLAAAIETRERGA